MTMSLHLEGDSERKGKTFPSGPCVNADSVNSMNITVFSPQLFTV